jgi:YHS domain-containing protein
MLAILARLLFILSLVMIAGRVLRVLLFGAVPSRQSRKTTPETNRSRMVRDPVCGMYLDSSLAVRVDRKPESVYFCSEDCRSKFLSA